MSVSRNFVYELCLAIRNRSTADLDQLWEETPSHLRYIFVNTLLKQDVCLALYTRFWRQALDKIKMENKGDLFLHHLHLSGHHKDFI